MSYIKSQKRVISQALQVVTAIRLTMEQQGVKAANKTIKQQQDNFEAWCRDNVNESKVNWFPVAYMLNQIKTCRALNDLWDNLDNVAEQLERTWHSASN